MFNISNACIGVEITVWKGSGSFDSVAATAMGNVTEGIQDKVSIVNKVSEREEQQMFLPTKI